MSEPLNENTVKFYLNFVNGIGRVEITEPISFDGANFVLKQDAERYGRDVQFADAELVFSPEVNKKGLTHRFTELLSEFNTNGFESEVQFIIEISGVDYVVGELDFKDATTDQINDVVCKVIQQTSQALIKRRDDISVDLFETLNIDSGAITPLTTTKMLLKAVPEIQVSEWDLDAPIADTLLSSSEYAFSVTPVMTKTNIEDTVSPYRLITLATDSDLEFFKFIEAQNTLTDITLEMVDFVYDLEGLSSNVVKLYYQIGTTYNLSDRVELDTLPSSTTGYDATYTLPSISRNETLWIYISVNNTGTTTYTFDSGTFKISSTSFSISSTTDVVRFIDAFRYVVESVAGMTVIAPRFDSGGEYYDQWITNGKLLRGLDEPFNISLKDLLGQLPEINADYQIIDDTTIFLGIYEDFYTATSMGSFTSPPNKAFKKSFNDRYSVNKLNLKYKKYEKTEDEDGSRLGFNTEMDLSLPNKKVENTKKIDIGFIRDTYLIEKSRKDAIKITDSTATKDDEDIYIIDGYTDGSMSFTEAMLLNHIVISSTELNLTNDGSFNFSLLGMTVGDVITITGTNAGDWTLDVIDDKKLEMTAVTPATATLNGIELVDFTYSVTATDLTNRTTQGFLTPGIEGVSNLRFTNKRNVLNYWGAYLNTCCEFRQTKSIIVNRYIHNGDLTTRLTAEPVIITENEAIQVSGLTSAILTPYMVETEVIADFGSYWGLQSDIKTVRGFITVTDNEGVDINIYPSEIKFDWAKNIMTITGEIGQ